jgi:DNA repair protein RecO (recombination protein O)
VSTRIVDQAIVLRYWEFSETSQTVSLFTRGRGMLRGLAKGARRERSAFSGGFELLTRGEISAILKPGTDLATLTEWDLQEIYWSARHSLFAHRAGMYLIDLVRHAVTDEDPHEGLWVALDRALRQLPTERDFTPVLDLQWSLLVETGYRPRLDVDVLTGEYLEPDRDTYGFSPRSGGLVEDPGRSAPESIWRVRGETVRVLRMLEESGPAEDDLQQASVDPDAVERASRLLAATLSELLGRDLPSREALFGESA